MKTSSRLKGIALGLAVTLGSVLPGHAIAIIWNYDYDTGGFFTEERKLVLEKAAARFDHLAIDSPDLPYPTEEGAYWDWNIINPSTGVAGTYIPGSLQAGTVTIYVGAYDLGEGVLGRGGPAGSDVLATPEWVAIFDTLNTPEVFKPYAGTLSLTNSSEYTWYSGLSDEVPDGEVDLYSVVLHELGHVFGIGTSDAWDARIVGDHFVGDHVVSLLPGGVQVTDDHSHFEDAEWNGMPLLLNTALLEGQRYDWSDLETAALQDLGYVLVPEPATISFAVTGFGLLFALQRRRRARQNAA